MLLAQRQLFAATRLSGYLFYWQKWVLEHELFPLYHEGMKWNAEFREIIKKGGGAADALKLQEEKKNILKELKEHSDKVVAGLDRDKLLQELQKLPEESLPGILEWSRTTRQNIIEGKTFISDEEATVLGVAFAHNCIDLKMDILDLIDTGTWLLVSMLSAPAEFQIETLSTGLTKMVWQGILISKNIDLLSRSARAISSKSVLALSLQNIHNGSRLTRR